MRMVLAQPRSGLRGCFLWPHQARRMHQSELLRENAAPGQAHHVPLLDSYGVEKFRPDSGQSQSS
jgi:hypothetical protein